MSEIERKAKAIIVEKLGVDESEVTANAQFVNDLGADSLDVVEVIMEFEKEFGISIPDDKAEKIVTVGQAISYIEMATGDSGIVVRYPSTTFSRSRQHSSPCTTTRENRGLRRMERAAQEGLQETINIIFSGKQLGRSVVGC